MTYRSLTALPVFNEARHLNSVLDQVCHHSSDVLVVDDGSTDGTTQLLAKRGDIQVISHAANRGYGAALRTAFQAASEQSFDAVITIDCDGQHEPQRIPQFVRACHDHDIVSGSRYLNLFPEDGAPPADRRRVNEQITAELNRRLNLSLTDAFCGFKGYRVAALEQLQLSEDGYGMPLELWVRAATAGLSIRELGVPLIYLDETRTFGGPLDDAKTRLAYYHDVLRRSLAESTLNTSDRRAVCQEGSA
ncbi:MAG: dolichyl-phosphate mannose synthase [Planctomycetaceae bacterium]|nr:dolichyl-phosphate mannose synthase [Planctomycetaceae bacterium]